MRVACLSAASGSSNPHWKLINYVERSSDGAWIQVSGAGHTYVYEKLPQYDSDKSAAVVANALAFKAGFQEEYGEITETTKTFSQRVTELMERKGWDAHKFAKYTRLEPNNYYRITRGETENPSIETILNISIGLGLPSKVRDELISLAGRSWQNSQLHCAYQYVLENGNIKSVTDFNTAFALLEIDASGKTPLKDDTLS